MKKAKFISGCLVLGFLLLGFSLPANAGTKCTNAESCSSANTCLNPCTVQISNASTTLVVQVSVNGSTYTVPPPPNDFFCVAPGSKISWETGSSDSFFFAQFNPSPFTNGYTSLYAAASSGMSVVAISPGQQTCSSFGAAACVVPTNTVGSNNGICGEADPRIVVQPGKGNAGGGKKEK